MSVHWDAGDAPVREAVERWLAHGEGDVLHDNPRRRIVRIDGEDAGPLLIKHFRVATGRHARRERWKARFGWSPAAREHAALAALWRHGVPVPEPLGLASQPDGDRLLILRWLDGCSWEELAARPPDARREAATALGAAVARLHAAGYAHGDLHRGNVLFPASGPVLLDLQHARATRSRHALDADLGQLDYSLWSHAALPQRLRIRAAALGLDRPFGAAARASLRSAGHAAERRAREHGRSRTRRALRPGRQYASLRLADKRGMRFREISEPEIEAALEQHERTLAKGGDAVWKDDGRSRITQVSTGTRSVIVKEVLPRGLGRRLADLWRGSPARRAWLGGHGLLARGVGATTPYAFVEQRPFGIPLATWVVLEDLSALPDGLAQSETDPEGVEAALRKLLLGLHLRGIEHGDLKSTHVHVAGTGEGAEARLLDLEGVRFRAELGDARRIRALAELNASLPDAFSDARRRRIFEGYSAALRFERPRREVLRSIVSLSLARKHRWTGRDCACGPGASTPTTASR